MLKFLAGTITALLSAGLGYWFGEIRRKQADRRRRVSVATVLLAELRSLERILRKLYVHDQAALSTVRLRPDSLDRFQEDILLFEPSTVRLLVDFRGLLRDIVLTQEGFERRNEVPDKGANHFVRVKAAFAAGMVPQLKDQLQSAGGIAPSAFNVDVVHYPRVPELPAPAFPEAVGDLPKR